ncbi:MAG: helix-turn-helix domain-containing protein [Clostridiales bacterium]|nr:helix-turn-helix domain-containing protein [Clostridiales bacterium]
MSLKELRKSKNLTQKEASAITGIPLRTYKNYENDSAKEGTIKYNYMCETLEAHGLIDEEHGILSREAIESACQKVLSEYDVEYCYLFGSYANETANEKSDVDLLISTSVTGLKFFGLAERLREELKKKVDLLDLRQLENNPELINEILRDGIKIYEKAKR